jgi:hypothetical protein
VIGARRGDQTLQTSYCLLKTLQPEDFVAVVVYDIRPEILPDFSTDSDKEIHLVLRNQYSIAYSLTTSQRPTSGSVWPTKREIPSNTTIVAKAGYTAPDELE